MLGRLGGRKKLTLGCFCHGLLGLGVDLGGGLRFGLGLLDFFGLTHFFGYHCGEGV